MSFDLALVDVEDLLRTLNLRNIKKQGQEVYFSCPFPGHSGNDATPSNSMQKGTTIFHCHRCGRKGNAITFLALFEGIKPQVARRRLREMYDPGFSSSEPSVFIDTKRERYERAKKALRQGPREKIEDPAVPQDFLETIDVDWQKAWKYWSAGREGANQLPEPIAYMFGRGFWWDTLEEWRIGFDEISSRIAIPWKDMYGRIIGLKGRAWWEDAHPKYLVLGNTEIVNKYSFNAMNVSNHLFALDRARRELHKADDAPLIVREGELNVISMHARGWETTVGTSGSRLSDTHVKLILEPKVNPRRIVFWFDDEDDGVRAAQKLQDKHPATYVVTEQEGDPLDLDDDQIEEALQGALRSRAWR